MVNMAEMWGRGIGAFGDGQQSLPDNAAYGDGWAGECQVGGGVQGDLPSYQGEPSSYQGEPPSYPSEGDDQEEGVEMNAAGWEFMRAHMMQMQQERAQQ